MRPRVSAFYLKRRRLSRTLCVTSLASASWKGKGNGYAASLTRELSLRFYPSYASSRSLFRQINCNRNSSTSTSSSNINISRVQTSSAGCPLSRPPFKCPFLLRAPLTKKNKNKNQIKTKTIPLINGCSYNFTHPPSFLWSNIARFHLLQPPPAPSAIPQQ
jgi:hypothetical protein